jgi:GT2 family glycosyltransferase|tara:strand:+ start:2931 stop:4178 length:1248 start_codon:yes stop_codon:yes gene_type:complete
VSATGIERAALVDIIVPVYRNLAVTQRCLESVLAHTPLDRARIIVIDDASPEPALSDYCLQLADQGVVTLLVNETNCGFVGAVNRGMQEGAERDVVLLNSDTQVPPGWLQRLERCAVSAGSIATVTPFSNNATICSYPFFCQSAGLPEGLSLEALDALFAEANAAQVCDLPTAVGFCVYITRAALDTLGLFDEDAFGRGYGEENDFSRRAASRGWRNVLCADLFVYHQGGASFGADSSALMAAGNTQLQERYPDYADIIADFVAEDPVSELRCRVDERRLALPGQAMVVSREWRHERERLQRLAVERRELEVLCGTLGTEIRHLRVSIDELSQQRSQYDQRCREYDERCARYQALLDEAREQLAITDRGLADLQANHRESLRTAEQLAAELDQARETLQQIYSSRVWRYSTWLRR